MKLFDVLYEDFGSGEAAEICGLLSVANDISKPAAKDLSLKGRGSNFKQARSISRLAKKKAQTTNNIDDDTVAQSGQTMNVHNIRS